MKITHDIIQDLLPAYFAGEASADTRALIEEFLVSDPEFARSVKEQQAEAVSLDGALRDGGGGLSQDHELRTLARTRALMERRGWFFGLALLFTALPLSFTFDNGRFTFLLVRDAPAIALLIWAAACVFWVLFWNLRQRLRSAGI